ncbi:MAG: efflux RND transporter permease subunit [Myxococcota bacterium]|nr:efflux RND transporter permease subunit [Myxococcota bacterium]
MSALFDAIIRWSVRRRHLVLVLALAVAAVGVGQAMNAQVDALPSFTPPMVTVQCDAPGLGSVRVEELVTAPLEQALLGTPDLVRLRSTSSPSLALVELTFEDGTDIFRARQLVSERLAFARARLPSSVRAPRLSPITAPVGSVLRIAYTPRSDDPEALQALWQFGEWQLRPRVEAIPGVSHVTIHGASSARVAVRPDPAAMIGHGVTLAALRAALADGLSLQPLGYASVGPLREPVRSETLWAWGDLDAIRDAVVLHQDGVAIRVRDIASVERDTGVPVGTALYDGRAGIFVQVDKLPWADTLGVTADVEAALDDLDAVRPLGSVRHEPTLRQADFVHTSIDSVARAMAIGAVLVVVILIAFLRSGRLALISLTAIPLSVLAAVSMLLAQGLTLNGMILGGLAIAVGEVVDDAIVDVENIWRRLRENAALEEPREVMDVIHDASIEVRGAVVYATFVVVTVLAPIMLIGGIAGRIFSPLAQAYALAMVCSLGVALTVTPAMCALLLPRLAARDAKEGAVARWLRAAYDSVLARVARMPGRIALAAVAVGTVAVACLPFLGGAFLPEFKEGALVAQVLAWPGTSLEETTRLATRIDAVLREPGPFPHTAARVGRASLDEDRAPVHRMELDIILPEGADPEELEPLITERIGLVPGLQFSVDGFLGERINELLSGQRAPIAVELRGGDLEQLQEAARRVSESLADVPGVESVSTQAIADVPTTDVHMIAAELGVVGLRRAEVAEATAALRQGLDVGEARAPGGFAVPLVVAGRRTGLARDELPDVPLLTSTGSALPFSAVVELRSSAEPAVIVHEGGERVVAVTASAAGDALSDVAERIRNVMNDEVSLPAGTRWRIAGQAAEREAAALRLAGVTAVVLLVIFVFLWSAFGSLLDATVVMAGLPLGMVGGVIAALFLPEGLSMAALIGFVTLFGIISRNGIMLVQHKNDLFAGHPEAPRQELVLRAAKERLIPITMTAATAFFGLLPLAASLGAAGSELEAPMALIVCGGLVSSTALNLVAVPAFYLWRHRREEVT